MGLRDTIQKAAQTAIKATGDVPSSAIYEALATTAYNASAGTNVPVYSSFVGRQVLFGEFSLVEIDGDVVRREDRRAFIAAKDISGVVPKPEDRIRINVGATTEVTWLVVDTKTDPADAMYILQVRRKA